MSNEIDRYRILIDLLKHQDSQINSFLTWNIVIQGALLAVMKLDIVKNSKLVLLCLQLLGAILAIFWILSGIRLKSYTDYYIERLKQFENSTDALRDFKLFVDGEPKTKRGVSKILYLKLIPALLALTWFGLFLCTLVNRCKNLF